MQGRQSGKTVIVEQMIAEAQARGQKVRMMQADGTVTMAKTTIVVTDDLELRKLVELPLPPNKLSLDPNSPDYHPCYVRVGVRIDGKERNDIQYYDVKGKSYMTVNRTSHAAESIEPYWRYQASRQQRRAEARWKGPRK